MRIEGEKTFFVLEDANDVGTYLTEFTFYRTTDINLAASYNDRESAQFAVDHISQTNWKDRLGGGNWKTRRVVSSYEIETDD